MSYLTNQLRAQAFILADDEITVADAPTGDIEAAAAAAHEPEAVPPNDDPAAPEVKPT